MGRAVVSVIVAVSMAVAAVGCDPSCEELEDNAFALRGKHARCAEGDTCQKVLMHDYVGDNPCLLAFQCTHALNAGADLEAFGEQAREIVEDYRTCNQCAQAGCEDAEELVAVCDVTAGSCQLVLDPDAGAGD